MNPWVFVGAGIAAALAFAGLGGLTLFDRVIAKGKELAFRNAIPSECRIYAALILQIGREKGVDPFLIAALMQQESRGGQALSPPGPGGTGDAGHGRGLMQIDDRSNAAWLASNNWQDPATNIRKGVDILKGKIRFLTMRSSIPGAIENGKVYLSDSAAKSRGVAPGWYPDPRPLTGSVLYQAAIAAYNTGELNALRSVAVGKSPDVTTANGKYSASVVSRISDYLSKFV